MSLFDMISQGRIMHKKGILKIDIQLDNGESRKKGDEVSILIENKDGIYHVEDNDFACKVSKNEITIL